MGIRSSLLRYLSIENQFSLCNAILFYDTVDSTQDIAISLAESNSKLDKTLVIANEQSCGKGRSGKLWKSARGG